MRTEITSFNFYNLSKNMRIFLYLGILFDNTLYRQETLIFYTLYHTSDFISNILTTLQFIGSKMPLENMYKKNWLSDFEKHSYHSLKIYTITYNWHTSYKDIYS